MRVVTLRLPDDMYLRVRRLAHTESLTGEETTWCEIVRRAVQSYLVGLDAAKEQPASPVADVPTEQVASSGFSVENDGSASFDY